MKGVALLWRRPGVRSLVWQALAAACVIVSVAWVAENI